MATHEIPEKDWETYFTAFTERHQGALVTIADVDPGSQPEVELTDLPFVSIAYRTDDKYDPTIELLTAASDGGGTHAHTIYEPKEVYHKPGAGVLSTEVNADEVLEITSARRPPIHYVTFRHR